MDLKSKLKGRTTVTSHDLYMALRAFGFYREHAAALFGHAAAHNMLIVLRCLCF